MSRRTSNAAKAAQGHLRPSKANSEPRYKAQAPKMPRGLSEAAQEIWRDLIPELAKARILTYVDKRALIVLCNLLVRYDASEAPGGKPFNAADLTQLRMLFSEFGMTPASRLYTPPLDERLPEPGWQDDRKPQGANVVDFRSLLRATRRKSSKAKSTPADTSGSPASDSATT